MGIIKSLKAIAVTNEKAWNTRLWNLYGMNQSLSGETVTEDTAMTYSAVFNAISLIAGTTGALPLHLMQEKGDKKRVANDKRAFHIMHSRWNEYMTAMAGRECLMAHILGWGNGYAEIVRNGLGDLVALWPIPPNRIRPEMKDSSLVYIVNVDGQDITLPRSKVLHIPGMGFDGFTGYSIISLASKSIGLGMAMESFSSLYFGQGTHLGTVLSHPNQLGEKARDNIEKSYDAIHGGLWKSHRLMLLEEGMKIEKVGIPPEDSQFIESRQFHISDIARWFNLPVHKLKEMSKSSFNNIQQEQLSFYQDSILPWLVRLEQNYDLQLLTESDKDLSGRGRLYFKHNVEGLLRADSEARGKYYNSMFNCGAMNRNEIRAKEDMDPVPGGDIFYVPSNMIGIDKDGKVVHTAGMPPDSPPALPPKKNGRDTDNQRGKRV